MTDENQNPDLEPDTDTEGEPVADNVVPLDNDGQPTGEPL